jgi:NADP-dependent 3-hydroxy acid dehydrogenase YdfG
MRTRPRRGHGLPGEQASANGQQGNEAHIMRELSGKVAVVTGAASGIGFALASRFATEGMQVVLADIETEALERANADLAATGAATLAVRTDVTVAESVEELARRAVERFGRIDVACNNAGVLSAGLSWEASLADYEWILGVNMWGVIHGVRTFVPIMLAQDSEAHIVNTSSMAGLTTLPYCSTT